MFSKALIRIALVSFASIAAIAADRLYLKDGTYQLVREYEIQTDRVHYYSTERGEWEDIPLELVDLERTKKEIADREAELKAEAREEAEESAAVKAARQLVESVPEAPGAYYIRNEKIEPVKIAESKLQNDKKRSVLKVLSPVPLVPGKATLELDGETSSNTVEGNRPEFFLRLSDFESLAIIKLMPRRGVRIVETASILDVKGDKIITEQRDEVKTFKKQEGELLYRIWPEKPLQPGEYAVIQFTDGKLDPQVWDFAVK